MKKSTRARSGNLGLGLVFAAAASLPALACQGLILGENAPSSGVGRGQPGDPGVSGPSGEPGNGAGGSGSSAAGRLSSPVSRLTNQEFVNSAKALLRLPQDVKLPDDAEKRLAAEPVVRGLTSDANGQQLTKGGLAGYSTFADSLTEAFLEGVA